MKRKNGLFKWILPTVIGTIITWTLLYTASIKDRGEQLSISLPRPSSINVPMLTQAPPAHEQPAPDSRRLYRWIDAHGKTHYGDRPPADAIIQSIDPENINMTIIDMASAQRYQTLQSSQVHPIQQLKRITTTKQTSSAAQQNRCQSIKMEIKRIDARMRLGYTAREGERLKKRRRELVDQRYEHCH